MSITPEQQAQVVAWRSLALERMPYMAAVLFGVQIVDTPGLGTFAVDKSWRMYVDFAAVSGWGTEGCAQVLLHECGHLLLDHASRQVSAGVPEQDRKRWNLAADMEWNDDLVQTGCEFIASTGVQPRHFHQPDNRTAEFYYSRLQSQPDQPEGTGCGSGSGGDPVPGEMGEGDGAPGPTAVERQLVQVNVAAAAREQAKKAIGSVPGGLVQWADSILAPPQVRWQQTLAAAIKRGVSIRSGIYDLTYSRRNRRNPVTVVSNGRVVNPGWYSPVPRITVVRDTSGSMSSSDLDLVGAEIEGISKQIGVRGDDLRVMDVDTKTHTNRRYAGHRSIAQVTGRGGTDMGAGIEAAVAMRPSPSVVVVVTDGWTPWPAAKPRVPVVVCLVGQGGTSPDWAATVSIKDSRSV